MGKLNLTWPNKNGRIDDFGGWETMMTHIISELKIEAEDCKGFVLIDNVKST